MTAKNRKTAKPNTASAIAEAISPDGVNAPKSDKKIRSSTRLENGKFITRITYDDGSEAYKCGDCGKWVTSESAIETGEGHYCQVIREKFGGDEGLAEIKASLTVDKLPAGWNTKVAAWHRACLKAGIPVSRMVKAFGGDRKLFPPARPECSFVYYGNSRYVSDWCVSPEGLAWLKNWNAPKEVKVKSKVNPETRVETAETVAVATADPAEVWK